MKNLLTTSLLCMFVGENAAPLESSLLESAPTSGVQQPQKAKQSSGDGVVILAPNKQPLDQKNVKSKLAEAKNKKHHHKKRTKHSYKTRSRLIK